MITGLVLAGGQASRLQVAGQPTVDKGLLTWRGEPLIALAQHCLAPHVGRLCISANQNFDFYSRYGDVIPDDPSLGVNAGPLAGVASVLARISTPWLAVIPVDAPNLPADLVPRLLSACLAGHRQIAYARTEIRAHPLCMLVHRDSSSGLRDFLLAGDRKVQRWQQANGACEVLFNQAEARFLNINRPEDCLAAGLDMPRD